LSCSLNSCATTTITAIVTRGGLLLSVTRRALVGAWTVDLSSATAVSFLSSWFSLWFSLWFWLLLDSGAATGISSTH
ncbi:hypothetical protein LDENG_00029010, partial [Lucifuga dentata]